MEKIRNHLQQIQVYILMIRRILLGGLELLLTHAMHIMFLTLWQSTMFSRGFPANHVWWHRKVEPQVFSWTIFHVDTQPVAPWPCKTGNMDIIDTMTMIPITQLRAPSQLITTYTCFSSLVLSLGSHCMGPAEPRRNCVVQPKETCNTVPISHKFQATA